MFRATLIRSLRLNTSSTYSSSLHSISLASYGSLSFTSRHSHLSQSVPLAAFTRSFATNNSQQQQQQQEKKSSSSNPTGDESKESDNESGVVSSSKWKKRLFPFFGAIIVGSCLLFYYRSPQRKGRDSDEPFNMHNVLSDLYSGIAEYGDNSPLLPPELPDLNGRRPRTVVLNVDKTLTHADWDRYEGWNLKLRPDLHFFLKRVFELHYEIVIFSDKMLQDTEQVIRVVDPLGITKYHFYNEQMNLKDLRVVKDLDRLDRDLRRVIAIDYRTNTYAEEHVKNVLQVKPFVNDLNDHELLKVLKVLEQIQHYNVFDVRKIIEKYNNSATNNMSIKEIFADEEAMEKEIEQEKKLYSAKKNKKQMANENQTQQSTAGSWLNVLSGALKKNTAVNSQVQKAD